MSGVFNHEKTRLVICSVFRPQDLVQQPKVQKIQIRWCKMLTNLNAKILECYFKCVNSNHQTIFQLAFSSRQLKSHLKIAGL